MHDEIGEIVRTATTLVGNTPRNYRCPKCGGEFHQWHNDQCPFCGLVQGTYGNDEETVELDDAVLELAEGLFDDP